MSSVRGLEACPVNQKTRVLLMTSGEYTLERELRARGHEVGREVSVPIMCKGELLGNQRLDMIVDRKLVVETKSTYDLHKAATRQVFNYLHATSLEVGLLLHFGPEPQFYRLICQNSQR